MNAPDLHVPYAPREGSKVAIALQAMADGPMTARAVADLIRCAPNDVGARLRQPLEADMVVRLQDDTGQLHYALSEHARMDGFASYHGPAAGVPAPVRTINPSDPFGLVASQAGPEAFTARTADVVKAATKPVIDLRTPGQCRKSAPSPAAATQAAPVSARGFDAAFFLSGDLAISVGDTTVRLNHEHQQLLADFISSIKKTR